MTHSPPYKNKDFSLVSKAREEFNKTLAKDGTESMQQRKGANPTKKRSALGKGLSALMSSTVDMELKNPPGNHKSYTKKDEEESTTEESKSTTEKHKDLSFLSIDQLSPNPKQPRKSFSEKELRELASSIRKNGLLQPLLVRKTENTGSHFPRYEIIAGERRWRASKEAGLVQVPVLIKDISDKEALQIGVIENIQRQDLNPIEEAKAYDDLHTEHGLSHEDIAKAVGRDRSSISNTLRLLSLAPEVQELLIQRKLTSGHARTLITIEDPKEQLELALQIIDQKISVREAENFKKARKKGTSSTSKPSNSPREKGIEDRLRRALGTKVKVDISASGKGEVKISFFSNSELENFLDKLGA